MEKLKSCPFCGSEADVEYHGIHIDRFIVRCQNGKCDSHYTHLTREQAIEAWNKRVETKQQIEDDELSEAHKKGKI